MLRTMKKKRELMQLQSKIEQLTQQQQQVPAVRRLTDVRVIESMITKFTGDDHEIRKWLRDLKDAFAMQFIACRRMLDGTAQVFARTITVNRYADLKAQPLHEFGRQRTVQEVYAMLRNRRLGSGESIHRYILDMQEIAMRSNIPELELVDLIIEGLGDTLEMPAFYSQRKPSVN